MHSDPVQPAPRRTLVTGAGQPLGMAVVRAVLAVGDQVVALTPRPERVPALLDMAQDVGSRLQVVAGDATVGANAERVLTRVGELDAMVHTALRRQASAGLVDLEVVDSLEGVTEGDFAMLMSANAWATLAWVRGVVPNLTPSPHAKVLVVVPWLASLAGKSQGRDYAYCASLAARMMVVRGLAADLRKDRIEVTAVNPGNYKTEIEGPSFQHSVSEAAAGVVGLLVREGSGETGKWLDWTGGERAL